MGRAPSPLAYGLSEARLREWGRFVCCGIEPPVFSEPALSVIRADGTIYCASLLSIRVGRPRLDDLLRAMESWSGCDYPARGGD